MKSKLLTIAALLFACAFSGCTHSPIVLRPKVPMSSTTEGMTISDERKIDRSSWARGGNGPGVIPIPKWVKPEPASAQVIGDFKGIAFITDNGTRAVDLVAGIVANRYPGAKVSLVDFRSIASIGVWMNGFTVIIEADVEHGGGKPVRFRGVGENPWSNFEERNFELAYERALEDFARQINAAPADLSRVVSTK